ncbi:MAG: hypothetical protein ACLP7Q_20270 [Isosphaeraceae bacterium]
MSETIASVDDGALDWRAFLTDQPPGRRACVDRAAYSESRLNRFPGLGKVNLPELQLYCDGNCKSKAFCKGSVAAWGELFRSIESEPSQRAVRPPADDLPCDYVLNYACEKCGRVVKSYSVRFWSTAASEEAVGLVDVQKIAEWPPFSPRTPSKVISLLGPDRDLFLKGRRAEIEGLGVGAFSYYRRIIEGQKNRLLDEIIRVAHYVGSPANTITELEAAKTEIQFSKAVDSVKDAIPPVLYIKGHNPFTLLHSALSDGLHNASDEECLVAASDIRLILIGLAERLTVAMKQQKELDDALNRLLNRNK